ncbi:MAG: hypothetical protein EOM41_12155, partial [Bacilli bacterium]|nr:hypothetical protein [Bacilli bacterium]
MTELAYNKKALRKGKAIGLPYMGSKRKIAKQIVQIIKDNFDESTKVYDLFGGGGAITAELLLQSIPVHYNELNADVRAMFLRAISLGSDDVAKYIVSKDEFYRIKAKPVKDVDDNLKLLLNSFGNTMSSYIYGVNIWQKKYELAKDILTIEGTFLNYRQSNTYKQAKEQSDRLVQLEQLSQLQHLQRLQQLQQLKDFTFETSSRSYEDFTDLSGQII